MWGDNYEISKTDNVDNDGNVTGGYEYDGEYDEITISGADMLKVVYSFDASYGPSEACPGGWIRVGEYGSCERSDGDRTVYIEGDSVEIEYYFSTSDDYNVRMNYYYAKIYPAYYASENDEGAEYAGSVTSFSQIGTYAETTTWYGKWYGEIPYEYENCEWDDELEEDVCQMVSGTELLYFEDENEIMEYISNNESLLGTTINLYAYNPYRIFYNGNGATAGTMNGFYTALDDNTSNSTADLMAYNFKKTGYGFAGWSENPNASVGGNSRIYGPNEKVVGNELTFDNNREATLYAVWVPSAGNLQGWSGCSSMASGQVTALTDTRDNNVYTVGKLADGNCWMMENLRLDAANSSDSTKAQGFGGVFTGLADSEDSIRQYSVVANSKYSASNIVGDNPFDRFPRYNNNNTNIGGTNSAGTTLVVTPGLWNGAYYDNDQDYEGNNDHSQWYGYGNYYTWAAAMANTANMTTISVSESANTSICPAGWQLPYGGDTGNGASSGGFSYLDIQLGGNGYAQDDNEGEEVVSNRWRKYPNNFVYSGRISSLRGESGLYWSRTVWDYTHSFAYNLEFDFNYINPGITDGIKSVDHAIRCLTPGS